MIALFYWQTCFTGSCRFQICQFLYLFLKKYLLIKCHLFSAEHEKSLRRVLLGFKKSNKQRRGTRYLECEMSVTLAEHLFKRLAPGESYVIDGNAHEKNRCACGSGTCINDPVFGNTNIGMIPFFSKNSIFILFVTTLFKC